MLKQNSDYRHSTHSVLLIFLSSKFGIFRTLLNLLSSCLCDRSHRLTIMSCLGLYRSSLLVFFLLSCYVCLDLELNQEKSTTNGTLGSYFGILIRRISYGKGFNLFYDSAVISLQQEATLPSWDPWNLKVNEFTHRRSKHKR